MKRYAVLFFLIPLFISTAFCQNSGDASVERVLDLDKSIFYALRNRNEIIYAQREIGIAEERVNEASTYRYPKVDLLFNYSQLDYYKDYMMILPPGFGSTIIPPTTLGHYYFTRVSLWQNIYAGGKFQANVDMARSNLKTAEIQAKIVTNQIKFEVKQAYYEMLSTKEKMKVYKEFLGELNNLTGGYKSQPDITLDKLNAEKISRIVEKDYSKVKNEYEQYSIDFLNTLGLELDTIFRLAGEMKPLTKDYNLNELMGIAFQNRPEPSQVLVQEKIDDLGLKLSMMARYPNIFLGANYELAGKQTSFMFDEKRWNATLNFTVPIYDGWASWSRIRQNKLQIEQNQLHRVKMEDTIRIEVEKAYTGYNYWIKELARNREKLDESGKIFELTPKNNKILLMESYKLRLQSELDYIDAVYNNLVSYATLEHAVGKSLTD